MGAGHIKYCICDISAIVNESIIFTAVLMSHVTHLHNTFAPHLISSKYIVNPNFHAVIVFNTHIIVLKLISGQ